MDKQQCAAGCGRSVGTGIASGLCVYCSVNRQIRNEADELTAASARIAELETAVADAYKAIENDPAVTDTVWFSDTETLCDRLFRALGEDRAAALLEKK
jgi:hypothetical protein